MNLSYDTFNPVYKTADQINTAMAGVYKWMFLAVLVSMGVAFGVGNTPSLVEFFFTGMLKWVVVFAPLIAVIGKKEQLDGTMTVRKLGSSDKQEAVLVDEVINMIATENKKYLS